MPDPIFLIGELQDPELRRLARSIRAAALTRGQAHEALPE